MTITNPQASRAVGSSESGRKTPAIGRGEDMSDPINAVRASDGATMEMQRDLLLEIAL
jgi:hypothetical protein